MSTPTEMLSARRTELIVECTRIEEELSTARIEEQAAEAVYAEKKAQWQALHDQMVRALPAINNGLPQHGWLMGEARDPLKNAERIRGKMRASKANLEAQLEFKRGDLKFLDRAIADDRTGPALSLRPVTRPQKIVEYDDLVMPQREASR